MTKILITNDSDNHSPDTWAIASAEMLCDTSELKDARAIEAQKLQLQFAEVLRDYHTTVQETARSKLEENSENILANGLVSGETEAVVAELVKLAEDSPWAEHFARVDVQESMQLELQRHVLTNIDIERKYYADRNPHDENVKLYRTLTEGAA